MERERERARERARERDREIEREREREPTGLPAVTQFIRDSAALGFTDAQGVRYGGRRRDEL